ncbi:glycosyltransferase family 4 protein [Marinobacter sp. F4206]|uniref:glycosyltransferase family 4 protein n=1 Tax=Marinobacter sp. F4206 TaxID=2861777 RepID=UPI001C5D5D35|nr:glycosyltransferase family 4 protein [Marinobacter sp. F4206]MBW4933788.1 glycosyltransferase family 4 protein [Marinobacter sp. F4206]
MERIRGKVLEIYNEQGLDAALQDISGSQTKKRDREKCLVALTRYAMTVNVLDAERTARALCLESERPNMRQWAALATWDSGNIRVPYELIDALGDPELSTSAVAEKIHQIRGSGKLLQKLPEIPDARPSPAYQPNSRTMLYVASSSRPYHVTGYTSRTHHILGALKASGWTTHCVTRQGYPYDRPDAREGGGELTREIDGIIYERLPGFHRRQVDYDEYLIRSACAIENAAKQLKPEIIQAASNYEAALPALIASRRLGIPFVYEVRGLWEYTAASKKPGWERTERFELDRRLEELVASHADHVFTLTSAMAEELTKRGTDCDRISLAPNGIEPDAFRPLERDQRMAADLELADDSFVVGYVGSIVAYEGLDDLIKAVELLVSDFPNLRLVVVGDGDVREDLEHRVQENNLGKFVTFTGKVPPSEVTKYFSLFNVIALPRKPYQVCRLVSPLKPLEAMAMNVPMVVSDVEALREMVTDKVSALVHKAGDPESLADAIRLLLSDTGLAAKLAQNARSEMLPKRTWNNIAQEMIRVLERIS